MILEAFLLGVSTGTVCITTCAPSAVPLFLSREWSPRRNALGTALFFGGRLAGYLLFGLILGALGALAAGYLTPLWEGRIGALAYLLTGVLLLMEGIFYNLEKPRFQCFMKKRYPWTGGLFLFGLLTGLHFCPPFFAAAVRVTAEGGGPLQGGLFFLFFFLGTSLYFLPLLAAPWLTRKPAVRLVARMTLLLMGGYFFLVLGLFNLGGQL